MSKTGKYGKTQRQMVISQIDGPAEVFFFYYLLKHQKTLDRRALTKYL